MQYIHTPSETSIIAVYNNFTNHGHEVDHLH